MVGWSHEEAQTASRRICTTSSDELLKVARWQKDEPRQLIPRVELREEGRESGETQHRE